jgi:hypothetical protein
MGVDGPYVDRRHLMIDGDDFHPADLSQRIDLGRRFDLVQSLEVAEGLPRQKGGRFCRDADRSRIPSDVLGRSPGSGR